ncbi:MAG: hypothetical protein HPY57_13120 [Ignavibacteria bacterium]|nr:hypothetical protein [Ignavibacteria bacterium]
MPIWDTITNAIKPIGDIINNLTTTDEERLKAQIELKKLENEITSKLIELETQLVEAQKTIITAEAQGQSWIQRNWRPITMLTFLILVVLDSLGILAYRLSNEAWTLLQIGLGGYVVGRSAEKIIKEYKK